MLSNCDPLIRTTLHDYNNSAFNHYFLPTWGKIMNNFSISEILEICRIFQSKYFRKTDKNREHEELIRHYFVIISSLVLPIVIINREYGPKLKVKAWVIDFQYLDFLGVPGWLIRLRICLGLRS